MVPYNPKCHRPGKDIFTLDIDINVAQLHNMDPLSLKVAIRAKTLFLKGPHTISVAPRPSCCTEAAV